MKSVIKCPFVIRFSILGIKKKNKAAIFHTVNVTHVNPNHKCTLSNISFRTATRISKSPNKIDLNALKVVIECMKVDPHLPALHLRPLLRACIPLNTDISTAYLSRFRRRCQLYLASEKDVSLADTTVAHRLLSTTDLTQDEIDILDVPVVRANYRSMYAKVMTNGSESWKALAYLNELKKTLTGFDFRIRLNDEHLPVGIVWMNLQMRRHLLQFGDILFLDSQKRQYNKLCWPYIGPVIRTGENKIRVIAESVVISEDLESYQWILESVAAMEPKWSLSNLRIIFSDGFITQSLLHQLRIDQTCTLRCDYWHVINEVLPKEHNFGKLCYPIVECYLKNMLTCDTEQEWNQAFNEAKLLLRDHPTKVDKLIEIHQRPSYYAGYYIRQIKTNLLLLGNTSAESNHSSITKHLSECGIWTISHQISKLMERQQYFLNMDQNQLIHCSSGKNYTFLFTTEN